MAKILIAVMATCFLPAVALAQDSASKSDLTAREMFMAARAKAVKRESSRPRPPAVTNSAKSAQPVAPEAPDAANRPVEPPAGHPSTVQPSAIPSVVGGRAQVIPAGYSTAPVGLRYTLIKVSGNRTEDVSPDTVFNSGDHIKVAVEVSDSGYLYVITQGSSGTWEPLFPSSSVENGDNRVLAGRSYVVPPGNVITFVGQPGTEKLFVIFSRQPEKEMDRLIYILQGGRGQPTAAPEEPKRPSPTFLLSSNKPIENSLVDKLRDVYSRDLIIEKGEAADQAKPAPEQDKSVYVVNRDGAANARVVADIRLIHQ